MRCHLQVLAALLCPLFRILCSLQNERHSLEGYSTHEGIAPCCEVVLLSEPLGPAAEPSPTPCGAPCCKMCVHIISSAA